MAPFQNCEPCRVQVANWGEHKRSSSHLTNFFIWAWKRYKGPLRKDRNGISIGISHKVNACDCIWEAGQTHKIVVSPETFSSRHNNKLEFECVVKNTSKQPIFVLGAYKVHEIEQRYRFADQYISTGRRIQLQPGSEWRCSVAYEGDPDPGSLKSVIMFDFQVEENRFFIAKSFLVHITEEWLEPQVEINPFQNQDWVDGVHIIESNEAPNFRDNYPIPEDRLEAFMHGLRLRQGQSIDLQQKIREILCEMFPDEITQDNYSQYWHNVLWLEEIGEMLMIRRYNMTKVTVKMLGNALELEVPGLAEKRPSLVRGDRVDVRAHDSPAIAYRGVVSQVLDRSILINWVSPLFMEQLTVRPGMLLDVRFLLGRLSFERQHAAVDRVEMIGMLPYLFPKGLPSGPAARQTIPRTQFINELVFANAEQNTAVTNIVFNTAGNHPYLIFGPPGTGKTVTVVEAILQLKKRSNHKILVCAPSNAACNMLTLKLMPFCNKTELLRIHSESADLATVSEELEGYSNMEDGKIVNVNSSRLASYRIIVATLILIGKYSGRYTPDVVFVDEAAQAAEPEADVALSFLSNRAKRLVLAGDPKQLGTTCNSKVAERYGYGKSLLERLMETEWYKSDDPRFMRMLIENYRSHELILRIPNQLFYDSRLLARGRQNDPISTTCIMNPKRKGFPLEFWGTISKEQREGRSPSYFNREEALKVVDYVTRLIRLSVDQLEIGVVTPYKRQVYKIMDALRRKGWPDVEVGTTETFQGREKRVIIISTVRAQHDLLKFDREFNLGFVKHDKRFNVALTRAKSKLIVIGCPHVLATDDKWKMYMELCETLGSYFGYQWLRRSDDEFNSNLHDVIERLNRQRF